MSLRVMRRDVCVGPTVCASRRFSPERQWWAQVSDSLLFTRRVPHADTKRERRRLDNFSIIRRRLALSVWIPLPKSNVTCVITTQSRVQLISVRDEERADIFPRSLISGKNNWNRPLCIAKKESISARLNLCCNEKLSSLHYLYRTPFNFSSNNSRLAESDVFQRRGPPLPSAAEHVFAAFSMSAHASLSCAYYSAASSRWINTCWKYYGQDICMWPKSLTSAPPCKQVSAKTLLNELASHGTICVLAKADLWKFCPLESGKMMLFLNCCPFFHFNTPNPVSLNFIGLYRITHLALFFSNIIFKKRKF